MNATHDSDIFPAPSSSAPTLAHAWAELLAAAWGVAWRHPGAHRRLKVAVENLGERLADANGYDAAGNDPQEQALLVEVDDDEPPDEDESGEPDGEEGV